MSRASVKTLLKRVLNRVSGHGNELSPIEYWEQRARTYQKRSVLNIGHSEEEFEIVTRKQKDILFPILKEAMTGNENIILDLGCGPGRFTTDLAKLIGGNAIGVDPIQALLDLAPKRPDVEYLLMQEGKIPLPDEYVDIVWITLVLGGTKGVVLDCTVAEICRVLKDGGLLFLVENTSENTKNDHWNYRTCDDYISMFPTINLKHISDYWDLNDRQSIFYGKMQRVDPRALTLDEQSSDGISVDNGPPIFIVGSDRSGTTLLRLMLNKHSRIDIPDESDFISVLVDKRKKYGNLHDDNNLETLFADMMAVKRLADWGMDISRVRSKVFSSSRTLRDIISAVFETHMKDNGKKRWGDKTPRYTKYITEISEIFPDALFIHIVRDGRDVAASLKSVVWFSGNIIDAAYHWKSMVNKAKVCEDFLSGKYIEIYYETLVNSPENVLMRLSKFLDEQFETGMVDFYQTSEKIFNEMHRGDHELLKQEATDERIGVWRKELSEGEISIFEFIAGKELDKFGYTRHIRTKARSKLSLAMTVGLHCIAAAPRKFLVKTKNVLLPYNGHISQKR